MKKTADIYRCTLIKESEVEYKAVKSSDAANEVLRKIGLHDECEEYFYLLCLNTKGKIVGIHEVAHGSLTECIVHPREVFKRALINNAHAVIVAHNHPSGSLAPSKEDFNLTNRLKECGEILRIPVLDHIIVSAEGYYSFAKEKKI